MTESHEHVSKIQKRYSLTLVNPSSRYTSFFFSIAVVSVLSVTTIFVYFQSNDIVFRLLAVLAVLFLTQYVDSKFIRNKEYSKSLHMSLFGNALWLLTVFSGILAALLFSKPEYSLLYVGLGMFLFISFRIGIYTTTLGASLRKAWLISFIQPISLFLVLVPMDMWVSILTDPLTLIFGSSFFVIASIWSFWTDRAGLPHVKSTHRLVQAYLFSLSRNDPSEVESIIEEQSSPSTVNTSQIRFHTKDTNVDFRLVIPEIHPGPFHPVGGSNIPYLIYKNLGSTAMIMHSISDHSLNLPSKIEVENYLQSFSKSSVTNEGLTCTEPVTVQINKARAVGILFDKTALLFLSLSPHGMEDIPLYVKNEIEQFSKNRSFENVLLVDCHNAMGEEISDIDSEDLLAAAKSTLDTLKSKEMFPLEFGYANSSDMKIDPPDLALGGLGILCLRFNNKKYFLGWADANNMENGVREAVVKYFSDNGYNLIEICTSDTHFAKSHGIRNRNGYYQLGIITKPQDVAEWFLEIAKKAETKIMAASFEILEHETNVKVMGSSIYRHYSLAVDKSLKITKIMIIGCVGLFLITML